MPKVHYELEQIGRPDPQNPQKSTKEKSEKNHNSFIFTLV